MPQRTPRRSPRTQRSPQERDARSQAVQRVADQALLRGSLVRRWVETGQEVDGLLDAISQQCLETLLAKKKETLARTRKEKPP